MDKTVWLEIFTKLKFQYFPFRVWGVWQQKKKKENPPINNSKNVSYVFFKVNEEGYVVF